MVPYCELYYHLVWTTKDREPLIGPRIESQLYGYVRRKAIQMGAIVFAASGTADHVHMVAAVPAKVALTDFVGQVKGVSSHDVYRDLGRAFRWQAGYGVLSLDRKRLPNYVAYVESQQRLHAKGTTIRVLEGSSREVYYHFIWAPRYREPVIEPRIESSLHGYMQAKAVELGATVFAVNGMSDHVHMVASVPPKLALVDFVGQVKGFSSHEVNRLLDRRFRWQSEYGAFSFDRKRLPRYVAYVENQKRHHAERTTYRVLERTSVPAVSELREPVLLYSDADWRRELEDLCSQAP